ncbi:MAG: CPBP family intramembrane glutamic endopeptidase [Caldicoprobacterales bacterium]|jgi:membrane protease YdiL (CAAX protease family)|nr:CPBP family intramembrane metalloprotease [Clostridiales bacterium]
MEDIMVQSFEEEVQKKPNTPTPAAGGILYLAVLLLMLLSSFLTQYISMEGDRYYIYMFLIQLITIGLPPAVYLIWFRKDIKYTLRLQKISLAEILLSMGMAVFGYFVIVFINLLWLIFLSRFGTPQQTAIPPIESGRHYLMAIGVIAVMPAVLEEILFRGVIQRGYERYGRLTSILLTGVLFAFLHVSIVSIPAIILLGILLCYVAYRANSIWVSMIFHFTNNAIAVTFAFLSNMLFKLFPVDLEGMPASFTDIPRDELIMMVIAWAITGFFALLLFGACFAGFHIVTRGRGRELAAGTAVKEKGNRLMVVLPVVLAILVIIVLLVLEVIQMIHPIPI